MLRYAANVNKRRECITFQKNDDGVKDLVVFGKVEEPRPIKEVLFPNFRVFVAKLSDGTKKSVPGTQPNAAFTKGLTPSTPGLSHKFLTHTGAMFRKVTPENTHNAMLCITTNVLNHFVFVKAGADGFSCTAGDDPEVDSAAAAAAGEGDEDLVGLGLIALTVTKYMRAVMTGTRQFVNAGYRAPRGRDWAAGASGWVKVAVIFMIDGIRKSDF